MPERYIALALTETQCLAVVGACAAAQIQIANLAPEIERALEGTGKTPLELAGLYLSVVDYISEKVRTDG